MGGLFCASGEGGKWLCRRGGVQYMRRYRIISEKVKQAGCWLLIIVLLPYIITVFLNGPKVITASKADETMVKIKKNGKMPVEIGRASCRERV